jgi:arsenate-mycothiol transferase
VGDALGLVSRSLLHTARREAYVDAVGGAEFETCGTDEPPERGIDGIERMCLIRDDIGTQTSFESCGFCLI